MKNYLKFLIFTLCLSGGFFGSGIFNRAQAACNLQIQFASDSYSINYTNSFNLSASAVGSGACGSSVNYNLMLISKNFPAGRSILSKTANLQNNTSSASFSLSPQSYKDDIDSSGNLTFQMIVGGGIAKSSPLKVAVTGIPSQVFPILPVAVSFSNSQAVFKNNDKTDITATLQVNGMTASSLQSVSTVYFALYVNDNNKSIAGFDNIKLSDLLKYPQIYRGLVINSGNGFKGDASPVANTVTVKFYQSGTSKEIGEGSAILQVQGLGTGASETSCTGTGKSTCADGQTCVSNKCQADTGAGGGGAGGGGGASGGGGMQAQPASTLYNPIKGASNLTELLLKIMRGFIYITGIWAVAFIVIGGFKMVISQGNEEAVAAAKKSITWAVIGLIVVLLAFSIIAIIQNLIGIDVKDVNTSQNIYNNISQKV